MILVFIFAFLVHIVQAQAQLQITTTVCGSATSVRMTGPWWGWDPNGGPEATFISDGTWMFTLNPTANMEYLLVVDGVQEDLVAAGKASGDWTCTPVTDYWGYANRLWTVGSGNVENTYGTCGACSSDDSSDDSSGDSIAQCSDWDVEDAPDTPSRCAASGLELISAQTYDTSDGGVVEDICCKTPPVQCSDWDAENYPETPSKCDASGLNLRSGQTYETTDADVESICCYQPLVITAKVCGAVHTNNFHTTDFVKLVGPEFPGYNDYQSWSNYGGPQAVYDSVDDTWVFTLDPPPTTNMQFKLSHWDLNPSGNSWRAEWENLYDYDNTDCTPVRGWDNGGNFGYANREWTPALGYAMSITFGSCDDTCPDTDGDGVSNDADAFPYDETETEDSDGDRVGDNADVFPNNPSESADTDGDGVGDNADVFPNDASESADTDGDGVGDNADAFPNDETESADTDGDGVGDNADAFPNDETETEDTDGDGVGDNADLDPENAEVHFEGLRDNWHAQTLCIMGEEHDDCWANNEKQLYTANSRNVFIDQNALHIKVIKETYVSGGHTEEYTSARLNSRVSFTYGTVEVRAKMPQQSGMWPAIWTLGTDISETGVHDFEVTPQVAWPLCGEIDITEQYGTDTVSQSSMHAQVYGWENPKNSSVTITPGFHIYKLVRSAASISFYVDDVLTETIEKVGDGDDVWPFDKPHFLLLNVAVADRAGAIAADFTEAEMIVDYVKITDDNGSELLNDDFGGSVADNPQCEVFRVQYQNAGCCPL